jgi:hypothetical protein
MSFISSLEPKNTEEVKPGLFVQSFTKNPSSVKYRVVHPAVWNGKVNWKNFILGSSPLKHFLIFLLLMFLVWSYQHDVSSYKDFYEKIISECTCQCSGASDYCTEEMRQNGECIQQDFRIDTIIIENPNK